MTSDLASMTHTEFINEYGGPHSLSQYREMQALAELVDGLTVGAGSVPQIENQDMTCEVAVATGDPITLEAVAEQPVGRSDVFVNSQRWSIGDGVKTAHMYFSADGGTTAKDTSNIDVSDGYYLGDLGVLLGGTTASDTVTHNYNS